MTRLCGGLAFVAFVAFVAFAAALACARPNEKREHAVTPASPPTVRELASAVDGSVGNPVVDAKKDDDPCAESGDASKKSDLNCADRKAWRVRAPNAWSEDCESSYDNTAIRGDPGIEFHAIAPGRWWVGVICTLGAYQGSSNFFLWDEPADGGAPRATPLEFPVPGEKPGTLTKRNDISNFADFDPKTKELVVWTRYRGPGDCGSHARYAVRGERVIVRELREQRECNGKNTRPETWPKVFPR